MIEAKLAFLVSGGTGSGNLIDFVVTVQVSVIARTRIPHLPRTVEAEAHAGPVH
jgi:hypothetical protein